MTHDKLTMLTRVGFAARGLLYLIIGWLVITSGQATDLQGALRRLSTGTERILLVVAVVGFVAYGLWRFSDAAFGTEHPGDGKKARVQKAGSAASGVIYLFLAYSGAQLLLNNAGGSSDNTQQQTQTALQLPAGGLLVGLVAALLVFTGIWQLVKAAKASFLDNLDSRAANEEWVNWFGRLGYGARGIIFILTGYFFAQAALSGSAAEAGGMQQALRWLSSPMNLAVGTGLFLFGLFSLVESRYRVIHTHNGI